MIFSLLVSASLTTLSFEAIDVPLLPSGGWDSLQAGRLPRLLRAPDIRGDTMVFSYAGDLWVSKVASRAPARRLTLHAGQELWPRISPDGRWIAFTGSYDAPN